MVQVHPDADAAANNQTTLDLESLIKRMQMLRSNSKKPQQQSMKPRLKNPPSNQQQQRLIIAAQEYLRPGLLQEESADNFSSPAAPPTDAALRGNCYSSSCNAANCKGPIQNHNLINGTGNGNGQPHKLSTNSFGQLDVLPAEQGHKKDQGRSRRRRSREARRRQQRNKKARQQVARMARLQELRDTLKCSKQLVTAPPTTTHRTAPLAGLPSSRASTPTGPKPSHIAGISLRLKRQLEAPAVSPPSPASVAHQAAGSAPPAQAAAAAGAAAVAGTSSALWDHELCLLAAGLEGLHTSEPPLKKQTTLKLHSPLAALELQQQLPDELTAGQALLGAPLAAAAAEEEGLTVSAPGTPPAAAPASLAAMDSLDGAPAAVTATVAATAVGTVAAAAAAAVPGGSTQFVSESSELGRMLLAQQVGSLSMARLVLHDAAVADTF